MAAAASVEKAPSYRLHRPSGQGVVRLSGQDWYLGGHGSPESRALYYQRLAEWEARGRTPVARVSGLTVRALAANYLAHAKVHYRKAGRGTSRLSICEASLKTLVDLFGDRPAALGPVQLEAVQQALVRRGLTRRSINDYISQIKTCYRWASSKELVPAGTWHGLRSLPGLTRGRSAAREKGPVRPVPQATLDATLAALDAAGPRGGGPTVAAMIRLQILCGARPGEICGMQAGDVDRTGEVWVYTVRPEVAKLDHLERARSVAIGPRAQELLRPRLEAAGTGPVFTTRYRRTPFTTAVYSQAIRQRCRRTGLPPWGANRLRHNWATLVRLKFGLEFARAGLGHADISMSEIYAERDLATASRVALEIG